MTCRAAGGITAPSNSRTGRQKECQHTQLIVREYRPEDLPALVRIWNEVVEDGVAFPQEELLKYLAAVGNSYEFIELY